MVDSGVRFCAPPHSGIKLGKGIYFGKNVTIEVDRTAKLVIGDYVYFRMGNVVASLKSVSIGSNTFMGEYTAIRDSNHGMSLENLMQHQPSEASPIIIGANVWIGRGAAVLRGIEIQEGAVVGANSVVTKMVPKNAIVAGAPARLIRFRA